MKTVTKYKAVDGSEFTSKADCLLHERLLNQQDSILNQLAKLPEDDGCEFANGKGYFQYDVVFIDNLKMQLLKLIEINTEWDDLKIAVQNQRLNLKVMGILGRYLDDSDSVFRRAYYRLFGNVDEQGREWGQMFYRLNPEKAEQIKLN